jgi:hypothetical protein
MGTGRWRRVFGQSWKPEFFCPEFSSLFPIVAILRVESRENFPWLWISLFITRLPSKRKSVLVRCGGWSCRRFSG